MEPPANYKNAPGSADEVYLKEYTEFINLATHDLDAPLRKLSTLVGMLTNKIKPGLEDTDVLRYIERIESCVNDMRSLIDGLAVLSRIISEKKDYTLCNMEAIVQDVIDDLHNMIKEKQATVRVSGLPEIEGAANQYKQVFRNIIENAIKFSRPAISPEIQVRSSVLTPEEKKKLNLPGDRIYHKIEIEDNGIGIKQENAERIFKPFERLHGKSQFGGHGIGLAICKRIITLHGGLIYAEGQENSGACFALILPQTADDAC